MESPSHLLRVIHASAEGQVSRVCARERHSGRVYNPAGLHSGPGVQRGAQHAPQEDIISGGESAYFLLWLMLLEQVSSASIWHTQCVASLGLAHMRVAGGPWYLREVNGAHQII